MKYTQILIILASLIGTVSLASENPSRGEIRMALRDGGLKQEVRYRYSATQLRIDRPGKIIPSPPANLIDLKKGTITILHPHNGTCEQGKLGESKSARSILPAIGPPAMTEAATQPPKTPPANWPEMPKIPQNLPQGIGPGAKPPSAQAPANGLPPGIPAFPEMPAFPMEGLGCSEPMALTPQNQTNELFGFSCRLFEAKVPNLGTLHLWLCDDPSLPPFYRLRHELSRRFRGQPEWAGQIAQLLRKEKQFPFRAALKAEGGDSLVEWRVLSIKTDVEPDEQSGIFKVPSGMYLLPTEDW